MQGCRKAEVQRCRGADSLKVENQPADVKAILESAKGTFEKALKIDGGVSNKGYFTIVNERFNRATRMGCYIRSIM